MVRILLAAVYDHQARMHEKQESCFIH